MINKCNDCNKQLKEKEGLDLTYDVPEKGKVKILKCKECFEKNEGYSYQECEVYSRVVGFFTPINRWHKGKQEEWKDRVTYSTV